MAGQADKKQLECGFARADPHHDAWWSSTRLSYRADDQPSFETPRLAPQDGNDFKLQLCARGRLVPRPQRSRLHDSLAAPHGGAGGSQVPGKAWGHDRIVVAKTVASEEELAPAAVPPPPQHHASPRREPDVCLLQLDAVASERCSQRGGGTRVLPASIAGCLCSRPPPSPQS